VYSGILAVLCTVCVGVNIFAYINTEKNLQITFLDVGQGDAAVIHIPKRGTILIDGGGSLTAETGRSTGKRIVYPYLNHKGISYLNAVFLTHPHIDHAQGIVEIMGLVRVGRLFIADCYYSDDATMQLVLTAAETNGVPVSRISSGWSADLGDAVIECVYPYRRGWHENMNNASLVLRLTYKDISFIFTGDIEKEDEFRILNSGQNIESDVLKVAHHGSNTSSSVDFITRVNPKKAIAGNGVNNSFGHPSPGIIELFAGKSIPFYNTADNGAILIETNGKDIWLTTMLN
jgi:competence protein ComEC